MKRIFFTILLSFLIMSNAKSQYSYLAEFFPLAVGNKWIYGHQTKLPPSYSIHLDQITKDTVIDGFRYFYLISISYPNKWIRFDTLTGNLLTRADGMGCSIHPDDYVLDSLNAQINDEIICSTPPPSVHRCTYSNDSVKKFYEDDIIARDRVYKYRVGITQYIFSEGGSYHYDIRGYVLNGIVYGDTALTGLTQTNTEVPASYKLSQNYPNPFNPSTKIRFEIPNNQYVSINVYDLTGKLISKLVNEQLPAGSYETTFIAQDLSSGIYYYKLTAGEFSGIKKMVLIK